MTSTLERAKEWCRWDPNEKTASKLQDLIALCETDATTITTSANANANASAASLVATHAKAKAEAELKRYFPSPTTDDDDANDDEPKTVEYPRIGFGTAGLRAAMDIGPMNMNHVVILQTTQGIAAYCHQQHFKQRQMQQQQQQQKDQDQDVIRIVIGYDHRAHAPLDLSSRSFAILSKLVFQQANHQFSNNNNNNNNQTMTTRFECILLHDYVPTPLLAYATSKLNAMIGIMVTASHNPKQDAGYKVYWKDGCQIRPPMDQDMAQCILQNTIPWTEYQIMNEHHDTTTTTTTSSSSLLLLSELSDPVVTQTLREQYFDAVRHSGLVTPIVLPPPLQQQQQDESSASLSTTMGTPPKFCYTAMHGVGYHFATQAFANVWDFIPPFVSVKEQEVPDALFPTVQFPNPEEDGALDIAKRVAEEHDCCIILANDPDADRLAVAEFNRTTEQWTVLTGDQIGALLGYWLWQTMGKNKCAEENKTVSMCASTVSSRLLSEMARVEGFHFEDTLTGFKWIGARAAALNRSPKYKNIFCYEEAIGFCCGDVIFDKDGITAMGTMANLAMHVYCIQKETLVQQLQHLYDKYGEFVSYNGYYFYQDPSCIQTIFHDFRTPSYPTTVGPYTIQSIRYLGSPGAYDSTSAPPEYKPTLPVSSSSPMLTLVFTNGLVAQFRASGTEPKFKYYLELQGQTGTSRDVVQTELQTMATIVLEEVLHPTRNGLYRPNQKNIKKNDDDDDDDKKETTASDTVQKSNL